MRAKSLDPNRAPGQSPGLNTHVHGTPRHRCLSGHSKSDNATPARLGLNPGLGQSLSCRHAKWVPDDTVVLPGHKAHRHNTGGYHRTGAGPCVGVHRAAQLSSRVVSAPSGCRGHRAESGSRRSQSSSTNPAAGATSTTDTTAPSSAKDFAAKPNTTTPTTARAI
jgi:hypothetical protein